MICRWCGEAGDMRRENPEMSHEFHKRCKGCDCAHVVEGEILQPRYEENK